MTLRKKNGGGRTPASERWFIAEEIPENSLYMMGVPTRFFIQQWPRIGLVSPAFRREPPYFINYFVGDLCQMWFRRGTFDRGAEFLSRKMLRNPGWALRVLDRVEEWSRQFFKDAGEFRTLPFRAMSAREMIRAFQKVLHWQELSHGVGAGPSWYSDVNGERFTHGVTAMLERRLRTTNISEPGSSVFSLLSTPRRLSFAGAEERAFLGLAALIQQRIRIRQLFQQATVRQLPRAVASIDPAVFRKLQRHCGRWRWLRYGYRGPSYDDTFFYERWRGLVRSGESPVQMLSVLRQRQQRTVHQQSILLRRLRLSRREKLLISLAQRIVSIKEYRKGALYHGMYCYEPFFREVARRLCLRLEHVWAMNPWELTSWLRRGGAPKRELDARLRYAVSWATHRGYRMLSGPAAKRFIAALPKEAHRRTSVTTLHGTCASPGAASGSVSIVNVPGDMTKMRNGNILISETTYPSLLPAMKKASAIVTNVGGLTCHAAIVSRELGIPCVVGTKIATKVLKDGDRVDVDATKGVVKKLNPAR